MKKHAGKIKIIILIILLGAVAGIQQLYMKDSRSLERLRPLLVDLKAFCALNQRYPVRNEFELMLDRLKITDKKEWLLFTKSVTNSIDDPGLKKGTLQYPMNLPILWAPGKAKISEFLPVIYAFVISEPCQNEIKK